MESSSEKVSIIMPAYNAERFIKQAIQSVINQTYENWELIVIDDCSQDSTADIILYMAAKDSRIRYVNNIVNSGVSESRNRGVKEAQNDWIAFLDSDDVWDKEKLEKQLELARRHPNGELFFTGSGYMDESGKISSYCLQVPEKITYRMLLKQNLISCSSVLVKKHLLKENPMKYDEVHEDYAVWLKILKDGRNAFAINEPLLFYRLSQNSKSSDKRKAALMTWRVYQMTGLGLIEGAYYFCWYTFKNLNKYRKIKRSLKENRKKELK